MTVLALNNPVGAGIGADMCPDKMWAAGAAAESIQQHDGTHRSGPVLRNGVNLFDDKKYSVKVLLDSWPCVQHCHQMGSVVDEERVEKFKRRVACEERWETIAGIMSYVMVYPHVSFGWVRAHNGHLNDAPACMLEDAAFSQQRHSSEHRPGKRYVYHKETDGPTVKTDFEADSSASFIQSFCVQSVRKPVYFHHRT